MWRLLTLVLLLAVFCLGAAVSYFNWTSVTFNYLAGQAEMPLIALLLAAFVLGVLVTGLLNLARIFMLRRDQRRQQRQIRELEAELRSLRNLPLAGSSPPASGVPAKNA
jgi:uncharacterized integral membrane protein